MILIPQQLKFFDNGCLYNNFFCLRVRFNDILIAHR